MEIGKERQLADFDVVIKKSLSDFLTGIKEKNWVGRENEAVNLYVFSYLLKEIRPDCFLKDPAQIGIEVAVPQVADFNNGDSHKAVVRKDLVIWDKPEINCWNSQKQTTSYPCIILEWKLRGFRKKAKGVQDNSPYDLRWLQEFSKNRQHFIGYAVSLDISSHTMKVTKVRNGNKEAEWRL